MRFWICWFLVLAAARAPGFAADKETGISDPAAASEKIYLESGERLRRAGRYESALIPFRKALENARIRALPGKQGRILFQLGRLNWNLGREAECSRRFVEALSLAKEHDLDGLLVDCRFALGVFSWYREGLRKYRSGRIRAARDDWVRALALTEERGLPDQRLSCLHRLARIHLDWHDIPQAKEYFEEALDLAVELKHRREEARCALGLGTCGVHLGEFSRALRLFERARDAARESLPPAFEARCWNSLGDVERGLGRYSLALDRYDRALDIHERYSNSGEIAATLHRIGDTWRLLSGESESPEDRGRALEHFTAALRLARSGGESVTRIRVLRSMGILHADLGGDERALAFFRDALALAEKEEDREAVGRLLTDIGARLSALGRFEEGIAVLHRAIDLAREDRSLRYLWEAYLESGRALEGRGRLDEALKRYHRAVSIIESIRSRIDLENLRATYLGAARRIEPYRRIIDIEARLHALHPARDHAEGAFHFMERAHARSFLDRLGGSFEPAAPLFDPRLRDRERMLLREISRITTRLFSRRISQERRAGEESLLKQKESELESLKHRMAAPGEIPPRPPLPDIESLRSFQDGIRENGTGYLLFSIGGEKGWACLVTRNDCRLYPVPSASALERDIPAYVRLITDRDSEDYTAGADLFRKLLGPAGLESGSGISRLVIVPDGILSYLPFEALPARLRPFRWLIQERDISYAPSLTAYRRLEHRSRIRKRKASMEMLAVGDPDYSRAPGKSNRIGPPEPWGPAGEDFPRLRYSDREVLRIGSLFPRKRLTLIRRGLATEEIFKSQPLSDYRILHFATHSLIDDRVPERSALLLSLDEDPREDGLLQMREISGLDLNADLTTVSACRSGLGRFIRGEGISGLPRTFLSAGSSAVLMSLWEINDQATSQLMERFYLHLKASESVSGALRAVKLEMIASDRLDHPFFWAGFVASGMTDRILYPSRSLGGAAARLLAFLPLVLVLVPGVRRRALGWFRRTGITIRIRPAGPR